MGLATSSVAVATASAAAPKTSPWLALGGLATQGVGAAFSGIGAMNQAAGQKGALEYQAQIAQNNAQIAGDKSEFAVQIGNTQIQSSQINTANTFGAQRAAMAANGIDLGEGSATDVLATTKYLGDRDALTIKDNAARQAWAYQTEAQNFSAEGQYDSSVAKSISPLMAGASSLLGGATSVAKSIYNYNKQGVIT